LIVTSIFLLAFALPAMSWQDQSTTTTSSEQGTEDQTAMRTVKSVNYRHGGSTHVNLRGTDLQPEAQGEAKVESRSGRVEVEANLEHLKPANSFGLAYLTYVLWGISPDGRPTNLGEMIVKDGKASIKTATPMQAFALIVTAEPDFAVAVPSDLVIAQNQIRSDTKGRVETVDVSYHVIPRDRYNSQVQPIQDRVYGVDKDTPLSLMQARNAVRIARDAKADQYAASAFQRAQASLDQAEDYYRRKQGHGPIDTVAREAVQSAEESRVIALRAEEQAHIQERQRESEQQTAQAQALAAQQSQQAQQAQSERDAAAQRASEEAQQRAQAEQQQQLAAQQAAQAQQQAQLEAQQRQQAELQAQQAQQQAQAAQQQAQSAEQDKEQTRARLMTQLNQVLETRDSARGLIVNMPDVLFDTGKSELKPTARERLAKVAGILLAYPDIRVEVDGYTDSTGTVDFNQQLSQQRADSVRTYLTSQGVSSNAITTQGFGPNNPIASNDSASGRQQNRRVELVVSGASIGAQLQPPGTPQ
jgi:outer membrane protein OmpA-like peptidoglycan-associated protein